MHMHMHTCVIFVYIIHLLVFTFSYLYYISRIRMCLCAMTIISDRFCWPSHRNICLFLHTNLSFRLEATGSAVGASC